jgi:hypothetical protein
VSFYSEPTLRLLLFIFLRPITAQFLLLHLIAICIVKMGLFTRRTRNTTATGNTTAGNALHNEKRSRQPFDVDSGNFNRRPSFGQW